MSHKMAYAQRAAFVAAQRSKGPSGRPCGAWGGLGHAQAQALGNHAPDEHDCAAGDYVCNDTGDANVCYIALQAVAVAAQGLRRPIWQHCGAWGRPRPRPTRRSLTRRTDCEETSAQRRPDCRYEFHQNLQMLIEHPRIKQEWVRFSLFHSHPVECFACGETPSCQIGRAGGDGTSLADQAVVCMSSVLSCQDSRYACGKSSDAHTHALPQ
jgi:hypothetical protein